MMSWNIAEWLVPATYAVLSLALLMIVIRLVRGPTMADRLVAIELLASIIIGIVAAYAVVANLPVLLDVAVVLALTGFLGAIAFSRYLDFRGGNDAR